MMTNHVVTKKADKFFLVTLILILCGFLAGCPKSTGGSDEDPAQIAAQAMDKGFAELATHSKTLNDLLAAPTVDKVKVLQEFKDSSAILLALSGMHLNHPALLTDQAKLLKSYLPKFTNSGFDFDRYLNLMGKTGVLAPATLTPPMRTDLTSGLNNLVTASWNFYRLPDTKNINPIGQFLNLLRSKEPPKEMPAPGATAQ